MTRHLTEAVTRAAMRRRQARRQPSDPTVNGSTSSLEAGFAAVVECGDNALKLREIAEDLLLQREEDVISRRETAQHLKKLDDELALLCEPEQYDVIVVGVHRNGSLTADVFGANGIGRRRVSVHANVRSESLAVGVAGLLSRNRNCLLAVEGAARWNQIGTFERRLDDGRLLVRHNEQRVPLAAAAALADVEFDHGDEIGFDAQAEVALARLPTNREEHLFESCPPDADFAQLGGLEDVVRRIRRVIDLQARPDLVARYGLQLKGILLEGPPGNGKTSLARCTASYVSRLWPGRPCRFMSVCGSNDYSVWLGQSEANIRRRFEAARKAARSGPVLLFFDELDAIGRRRGSDLGSGAPDRVLNTLLGELDGMRKLDNVLVVAATNRADTLDAGLIRAGRFDVKLHIPPPNRRAAVQIVKRYLADRPVDFGGQACDEAVEALVARLYAPRSRWAELAVVRFSDGTRQTVHGKTLVSGAMLETVVQQAAEEAADREAAGGPTGIALADLSAALDRQLLAAAGLLTPGNVKSYVRSIRQDSHVTAVDGPQSPMPTAAPASSS